METNTMATIPTMATDDPVHASKDSSTDNHAMTQCYTQISKLQHTCSVLQRQLEDMAKAKDEANESERRVRRGLYRLASGRLNIGQVLQAVEKDGSSTLEDLEDIQGDILSATTNASTLDNVQIKKGQEGNEGSGGTDSIVLDGKVLSSSDVILMKKKMDDLELVNDDREKRIQELLTEKEGHEKKVNELLLTQQKDSTTSSTSDVTTSPQYAESSSKLAAAEKEIENFKIDLKSVQDRWAVTKGDLELARKSVIELEMKHKRRLRELLGLSGDDSTTEEDGEEDTVKEAYFDQGKTVMELEHKLKHALDNVRQAESIRNMLGDAHALNEILKREILELKNRNEELSASKTDDNSTSSDNVDLNDKESRKLKKELEAAIASKAQAKDRLEQALKERDALLDMNQRLQQQCVEKDDMNAKSLSSILHLKQLSEQLEQEKVKMEISLKSAQQLALTARLAANAKIRVEEEATKEKEIAEAEMKRVKEALEALQTEKNAVDAELAACKAKIEQSKTEASGIRKRCDDLVIAANASEKERKQLEEALLIAKKDAAEAVQKAAVAQANARGGSGDEFDNEFTKEELTILVNDLKSRLACPVCNTREKKVINTRCRHMFCRQCVDKSLENRNRKCPSCGIRFDKKDIEDVWF
jgi:E3 ubiquitin-protein ligase BRE1